MKMGRTAKPTRLVRAPKDILNEWNMNFPDINHADIIRILWRTSPLRWENSLRKRNKQ